MQTDVDELIHVKLEDELVDVPLIVDSGYGEFVTYENGRKVQCCCNTSNLISFQDARVCS
jgi:hypothetical protein